MATQQSARRRKWGCSAVTDPNPVVEAACKAGLETTHTPVVQPSPVVEVACKAGHFDGLSTALETTTTVPLPTLGLVLLVGISGSGKSTFAAHHFAPTQVVSSDFCRALVSDDENDQSATPDAFAVLNYIVGTRLRRGLLTVVDATNVQKSARAELIKLAKDNDVLVDAIVLDVPESTAIARQKARGASATNQSNSQGINQGINQVSSAAIARQYQDLKRSLPGLRKEGFRRVHILSGTEIDNANITYQKSWNDLTDLHGPFDIIGDVHGCLTELCELLTKLGYVIEYEDDVDGFDGRCAAQPPIDDAAQPPIPINAKHPAGRTAIFVGDLVDRGPNTPGVLRLVMGMVESQNALCVTGNHEVKLVRALKGAKVQQTHGIEQSLAQLNATDESFQKAALHFMDKLVAHYVLDDGRLVVAHAGLKEAYHGRASNRVKAFALYGDTTGESDEYGLPVRLPWAQDYRGKAMVVYGHTPTLEPEWINNTICVDTGCVFGGKLTALRYPERELVSVAASAQYYQPAKPLAPLVKERVPGVLQITDVTGTQWLETELAGRVKVPEENAAAALEVMSRFAIDPRWLIYLPPTMSPAPAATAPAVPAAEAQRYLERPEMAFAEYARAGVTEVVCEEKHMGSRAVAVIARDAEAALRRFGIDSSAGGTVYSRTGRQFFEGELGDALVERVRRAIWPLFDKLDTDWLALDCELLPWSAKALGLITEHYAPVGAAADAAFPTALQLTAEAANRGLAVTELHERLAHRAKNASSYRDAYAAYIHPTDGLTGITLAPFQILAGEGEVYALTRDHRWQLQQIGSLTDPFITQTPHRFVKLPGGGHPTRSGNRTDGNPVDGNSPDAQQAESQPAERERAEREQAEVVQWWLDLTASGGEGMVVKPVAPMSTFATPKRKHPVQPGLKVRGREYLRIIYGPDYLDQLAVLRQRNTGRKQNLAWREFGLGMESLTKFVAGDPLWQVHQLAFAVLALESEALDPRL